MCLAPQASCRCGRVTSNVRPRVGKSAATRGATRRTTRLRPSSHQPRGEQLIASTSTCVGCLRALRPRQYNSSGLSSVAGRYARARGRPPLLVVRCASSNLHELVASSRQGSGNKTIGRPWQLARPACQLSSKVGGPSSRGVHGRHVVRGLTLRSTRRPPATRQGREAAKAYHLPRGPGAPLAAARYLKR